MSTVSVAFVLSGNLYLSILEQKRELVCVKRTLVLKVQSYGDLDNEPSVSSSRAFKSAGK